MEARLPAKLFLRANRSQLVNLTFIESIGQWFSGSIKVRLQRGNGKWSFPLTTGADLPRPAQSVRTYRGAFGPFVRKNDRRLYQGCVVGCGGHGQIHAAVPSDQNCPADSPALDHSGRSGRGVRPEGRSLCRGSRMFARAHGIPLAGIELAPGGEGPRAGDSVTLLVELSEPGRTRQWLAILQVDQLNTAEKQTRPPIGDVVRYTTTGNEWRYPDGRDRRAEYQVYRTLLRRFSFAQWPGAQRAG